MAGRLNGARLTRQRRKWAAAVDAGLVKCRRCGDTIHSGQTWDLGHAHDVALGGDPRAATTPEHALRADCVAGGNRSAGAVLGNQLRRGPRRRLAVWLR